MVAAYMLGESLMWLIMAQWRTFLTPLCPPDLCLYQSRMIRNSVRSDWSGPFLRQAAHGFLTFSLHPAPTELLLPFLSLAITFSETASCPVYAHKAQGIHSCFYCVPTGCSLAESLVFKKLFTLHGKQRRLGSASLTFSVWTCPSTLFLMLGLHINMGEGSPAQWSTCHPPKLGEVGSCPHLV